MTHSLRRYTRGFTLIELLVVIAIIALLAAIVLVSLQSSRRRSRDARRVADLNQVALALSLYHDNNRVFPQNFYCGLWTPAILGSYISQQPKDPLAPDDAVLGPGCGEPYQGYYYHFYTQVSGVAQDYVLRATLEDSGSPGLRSDIDGNPAPGSDQAAGTGVWGGGGRSFLAIGAVDCNDPIYCIQS